MLTINRATAATVVNFLEWIIDSPPCGKYAREVEFVAV
jgi:hypothetical protein